MATLKHKLRCRVKTLFNFIKNSSDPFFVNPCENAVLKKTFRVAMGRQWLILEKDAVDEIIFRTDSPRDRLMLELMARGGMRIDEVLKLRMRDVDDCKLFLVSPKSGGQNEVVYIPKKVAAPVFYHEIGVPQCPTSLLGPDRSRSIVQNQ